MNTYFFLFIWDSVLFLIGTIMFVEALRSRKRDWKITCTLLAFLSIMSAVLAFINFGELGGFK